jgi:hypothetical protein
MPGDHLKADLSRIGEVSARISRLTAEFSAATQLASGYSAELGSAQLASAFDSFANGWARHRQQLISDLRDVAAKADLAVQEYERTDHGLAGSLRKEPK